MGSFFRYVCSILPLFFFTVCYTSSTRDDLKDKQSAYFSERIRNTASPSCNTFVTLFSNGRVHLCKLDRANPRPSRSLNNTLDALLPNSNKSLMETHTMQTLPPFSNVHTHTHIHTGPNHLRVSLTAFPTSLLSVDRPVQQLGPRLMSPTLLLVPFFFFSSPLSFSFRSGADVWASRAWPPPPQLTLWPESHVIFYTFL